MLQISSYNTYYSDIFCGILNLRLHTAYSSDNKLNLQMCIRDRETPPAPPTESEKVSVSPEPEKKTDPEVKNPQVSVYNFAEIMKEKKVEERDVYKRQPQTAVHENLRG